MSRWKASAVNVSLALPGMSLSGSWEPDDAEKAASWELLVELSTRVAAVELADDDGLARDALTSLYGLFDTTRGIMRAHGPGVAQSSGNGNLSFGVIAVRVLNDLLRPLLSEWHPRLAAYESQRPADVPAVDWEYRWEHNDDLRAALRKVRPAVRQYLLVLAEAADVHELALAVLVPNSGQASADNDAGWRDQSRARAIKLGFRPRHRMVRWFDLGVLFHSAWRILRLRGRPDPRAAMSPAAGPTIDVSTDNGAPFWFDYVADLGDAFDPTMAIAWHLGRDTISTGEFAHGERIADLPRDGMPRGRLLVMGGDEVYPYPSRTRYRDQTTGPYELALPPDRSSTVVAIPGNHDWYDGLVAFSEVFIDGRRFGGWLTPQDASWFGVRLPHGWWLWALDTGLGGDINESQRAYFAELAGQLEPGDRIIVAHPIPAWRLREEQTGAVTDDELGRIKALLETVVPDDVTVPLFLAGDTHIYAHYTQTADDGAEVHHVTCGGGGAFLHPTHNLAPTVPQSSWEPDCYRLQWHWPPRPVSRHTLARSTRGLVLDRQNVPLVGLLALVHLAFAAAAGGSMRSWLHDHAGAPVGRSAGHAVRELAGSWGTWVGLLAVVAICALVIPRPNVADPLVARAARRFGSVHGVAQAAVFLLAASLGGLAIRVLSGAGTPSGAGRGLGSLVGALVGGMVSTTVFAHYLRLVNQRYRIHDNEAFSGRHIRGYKHFIRCRIDETGDLRLHVIGLESVRPGWAGAIADGVPPPTTALTLVDVIDISAGATP